MNDAATARRTNLWFTVRVAVTLVMVGVLWQAAGGAEVAQSMAQAAPLWVLAAVATLVLQTLLSAQRWRITAAQLGQTLPSGHATREYFLSQTVNQALPGAVMGDAARAVRARDQGGLLIAGQAVFFERLAGQFAMFATLSLAFLATSAAPGGLEWPTFMGTTLSIVVVAGAVAAITLISLRDTRALQPLTKALFAKEVMPGQFLYSAAIATCNLAAFAFAAQAVGVELSVVEITALVPMILFAMLVPLTVSGWGIREGAAALILPIAGISVADSVAASVMFGLALLISVLPGAFVVMTR